MDRISQLPDALILQILSLVPTKDVLATSILSKRWKSLWTLVPKLEYDDSYRKREHGRFLRFVDKSLLLHRAPILQSLHLNIGSLCSSSDIGTWVRTAVDRCVQELKIDYSFNYRPLRLPRSLYTSETLVVLKLKNAILVDVLFPVCFPLLRTLHLLSVRYSNDESVGSLLSNCPVLEDLVVERYHNDNVRIFNVVVPSLQRLSLSKSSNDFQGDNYGFVINAPSLKYLTIVDYWGDYCLMENMSEVVEANVDVIYSFTETLLGSLSAVKHLSLCLVTSKAPYHTGNIFHHLVRLELCTCASEWWNLLLRLLEDSPKLRVLKLEKKHRHRARNPLASWNQPSSVPECLLFHLETLVWNKYKGTREEKKVMLYVLMNAKRLKMATISPKSTDLEAKHRILKELAFLPRASATCNLVFV